MEWTEEFCQVLRDVAKDRPNVGRTVRVIAGRKNVGAVGQVTWHGPDRFDKSRRYCDSYQNHLRDCMGKGGFRVRVKLEDGSQFFTSAANVEIVT